MIHTIFYGLAFLRHLTDIVPLLFTGEAAHKLSEIVDR